MDLGTSTAGMRPLIGREQEVRTVCVLLQETTVRLLTLTGPGGVGKTRLAIQVGTEMATNSAHFPDGCYFVSLTAIREKELVLPAVIQALGLKESGQQPLDLLKLVLREKQLLLVLDNFEQVIDAAPLLNELLLHCLSLKIVITSRTIVHLYDEYVFQVAPLALPNLDRLPDNETLAQFPAIALFLQRVKKILPEFSLTEENARTIAEICVRLDGLPLALEMAAARMKLLTPQSLLARLNHRLVILTGAMQDVFERQQTLRRTLEWSYHLLSPREQLLFQRLAVFAGGVSLQAMEAVWATLEGQADDALDLVTSLVDKNLLQVQPVKESDEPRFLMLETLHEYALECLEYSGKQEQTRQAHALHYLALAEELAPKLTSMEQVRYLKVLEQEYANLRAAIGWLITSHEVEYALRICVALRIFWMQCHAKEGFYWIRRALSKSEANSETRAWALYVAGDLAYATGNSDVSSEYGQESLKLFRILGDKLGILILLNGFGHLALEAGDGATLATMSAESLQLAREVGDHWRLAEALFLRGYSAYFEKDYSGARHLAEECLVLCQEIGEPYSTLKAIYVLALFAHAQDDYTKVHALYKESFSLVQSVLMSGHDPTIAMYLLGSGAIAAVAGHPSHAAHLWGAVSTRHDITYEVGSGPGLFEYLAMLLKTLLGSDQILKMVRNQLSDQEFVTAWNEGQRMSLDQLSRSFSEAAIASAEVAISIKKQSMSSLSVTNSREKLTPRETEVLGLVAEGLTSSQVAQKLNITLLTVNSHVRSIYSKLGITTRSAATRYVLEQNL